MEQEKHLILGFGYTAVFLKAFIQEKLGQVITSSRSAGQSLIFNLENPETWDNIPQVHKTYWMFPATPIDLVQEFYEKFQSKLGQLVVVGSTSGFEVKEKDGVVNEKSSLNLEMPRVEGEEYLRSQGAITVMSSGIYGPDRDPLSWVEKGYVGKSDKYVNMIHVKDLSQCLYQAGMIGEKGAIYIASDNNPQRWKRVIEEWEQKQWVQDVQEKESSRQSKRIDSSLSLQKLKVSLKFQNFVDRVL